MVALFGCPSAGENGTKTDRADKQTFLAGADGKIGFNHIRPDMSVKERQTCADGQAF